MVNSEYEDIPEDRADAPKPAAPTEAAQPEVESRPAPAPAAAAAAVAKHGATAASTTTAAEPSKVDLSNFDPTAVQDSSADEASDEEPIAPRAKPVVAAPPADSDGEGGMLDDFDAGELDEGFWDD